MKLDFKTSGYFSGTFIFVGILLFGTAIAALKFSVIASFALLVVSLVIFTTHYRITIDLSRKTFHDYLWILGFKNGERGSFETIQYLFIKKGKESQTMNLRVVSSTIQKDVYDGYLKFSENSKIHLMSKNKHEDLLEALKPISTQLNVQILDYTSSNS